jgi:hypothetical protein
VFVVYGSGYWVWGVGCGVEGLGFRVWSLEFCYGCRVPDFRIEALAGFTDVIFCFQFRFRVQDSEFRIQGAG